MTGRVIPLPPSLRWHLARSAALWADLLVEGMAARRTNLAGIAILPDVSGEVYGEAGCRALAEGLGRSMPRPPRGGSVLVLTRHCTGWVSVSELAEASAAARSL